MNYFLLICILLDRLFLNLITSIIYLFLSFLYFCFICFIHLFFVCIFFFFFFFSNSDIGKFVQFLILFPSCSSTSTEVSSIYILSSPKGEHIVAALSVRLTVRLSVRPSHFCPEHITKSIEGNETWYTDRGRKGIAECKNQNHVASIYRVTSLLNFCTKKLVQSISLKVHKGIKWNLIHW